MRKGTSAFGNIGFLKSCIAHEINPMWNLLIGFPGEPASVYEKYTRDIPLLTHLPPPSGVFSVRFDRYSPYFTRQQEYGLRLEPMDFYRLVYPFERAVLENMAYYFSDTSRNAEYLYQMADWHVPLTRAVAKWKRLWSQSRATRPVLVVRNRNGRTVVYDSRGERPVEYPITDDQAAVLRRLSRQTRLSGVGEALGPDLSADANACLRFFNDKKLLFTEDDRIMSLVCFDQHEGERAQAIDLPVRSGFAASALDEPIALAEPMCCG